MKAQGLCISALGSILFFFTTTLFADRSRTHSGGPDQEVSTATAPSFSEQSSAVEPVATAGGGLEPPGGAAAANPAGLGNPFNYQTDLITGRFACVVPIVVPPARQGAQPALALTYNSAGGNTWCGVGWSLEVGFIQRDTRRGPPIKWGATRPLAEYDDNKCFVANFGGVNACLVAISPANASPTEYRAEVDSTFLIYRYYWNQPQPHWQVIDKSGNTFFFGRSPSSRMENSQPGWNPPNFGRAVFRWALDRVLDVNGNETELVYSKDGGMLYLARLSYNGNNNDPALVATHTVEFHLQTNRADKTISYQPGYRVETRHLLAGIVVRVSGSLVRRYSLVYTNSSSTYRSLLAAVTLIGSDDASALPAQTFSYQVKPFEFEPARPWPGVDGQGAGPSYPRWFSLRAEGETADTQVELIDIDADGLPDRVMRPINAPFTNHFVVQRNTGTGFAPPTTWGPLDSQGDTNADWNSVRGGNTRSQRYVDFADINGDGFPDRIMRRYLSPYTNFMVQLNSGSPGGAGFGFGFGFGLAQPWGPVTNESSAATWRSIRYGQYVKVDLLDLNADGLPDRIARVLQPPYDRFKVQLNTGNGFSGLLDWGPLESQGQTGDTWNSIYALNDSNDTFVGLYDLNGDGLPDRVMRRVGFPYTNLVVQFNHGAGFDAPENWNGLESQGESSSSWNSPNAVDNDGDTFAALLDMNGDGLPDRVLRKNTGPLNVFRVQLNTGSGFATNLIDWGPLELLGQSGNGWASIRGVDNDLCTHADLLDINGDGLIDRVLRNPGPPLTQWWVQLNKGPSPDLLCQIHNGLGGVVQAGYRSSTESDHRDRAWSGDPWTNGAISCLGFPVWTVSSVTVKDGMDGSYTTTYDYEGGCFDASTREFRGFNRVEVTDPRGAKTVTYFHQSGGRDESIRGEWQDQLSRAKKGMPFRIESWGADRALYHLTLNKVEETLLHANGWYFPHVSQTIQMDYEGTESYRATAQSLTYDPGSGNVLVSQSWGEVTNVNVVTHSFTDVLEDSVFTLTTYARLANEQIRNKPAIILLSSSAEGRGRLRETRLAYEGLRGNLTNAQVWLSDAEGFRSTLTVEYDAVGNPTRALDAAGVGTITTYDPVYQTFPIRTVAATFTNEFVVDARCGGIIATVDPKGLVATNVLDPFFRSVETRISTTPYGPPALWRTRTAYTLGGATGGWSTNFVCRRAYDPGDPANGIAIYSYADGLGRMIQTRAQTEIHGQFRVVDVLFEERGLVTFSSRPYFSAGSAFTILTGDHLGTYAEFDPLGRTTRVTPACRFTFRANGVLAAGPVFTGGDPGSEVGSATYSYRDGFDPWVRVTIDGEGKTSKVYRDAFTRSIRVVNVTGAGEIQVRLSYDLLGNLTNVTDDAGVLTRIAYDSLGRKTSLTDADMGTWRYRYDAAGRLSEQIDGRGNRTRFLFEDPLGRLTRKEVYNSGGQLTNTVTYAYDEPSGWGYTVFKGQLAQVRDNASRARFSYDFRGRMVRATRSLRMTGGWDEPEYTVRASYDDADRVMDLVYPSTVPLTLRHFYTNGVLARVQSLKGTGLRSETFYRLIQLNELGQVTRFATHNGRVTNSYAFFPNSSRLQRVQVTNPQAGFHQDLAYTFDRAANVRSIADAVHAPDLSSSIENAQYDDLHRLVQLSDRNGSRAYGYDTLGNLLMNSDSGTNAYQYDARRRHAVTRANGKSYAYDACGNMTARGSQLLRYDEENRLSEIYADGAITTLRYAHDGARLWKQSSTGLTIWIGDLFESGGGRELCHIYAGGRRLASIEPAFGGPYVAGISTWQIRATLGAAALWPWQERRAPLTVLLLTLGGLLGVSVAARRGWLFASPPLRKHHSPGAADRLPPIWRQALSAVLVVELVFVTTPLEVEAAGVIPLFCYYHVDHLGSSNLITDREGNLVQGAVYHAYGRLKSSSFNAATRLPYGYTGQMFDEESGLYYYHARYYDPELGRFIQPDTMVPDPGNPQCFNRYAYANNNPLKYVDPAGHDPAAAILVGVIVGVILGASVAAAQGANGQGIALSALAGGLGGLFGSLGVWAGGVLGSAASGAAAGTTGAAAGAAVGSWAGAIVGGAAGGAVAAAVTGGDIGLGAAIGAAGGAASMVARLANGFLSRVIQRVTALANTVTENVPAVVGVPLGHSLRAFAGAGTTLLGVLRLDLEQLFSGLTQFGRGLLGVIGVEPFLGRWDVFEGMTGMFPLPEDLADAVREANSDGAEHAYDAGNGMHGWHAASNAGIASKLGPVMLPAQWLAGFAHEFLDLASIAAEIKAQGVFGWLVDSMGDLVANTVGLTAGLLAPPGVAGSFGRQIGNAVPGLADADPFGLGLGGRYEY